MEQEAFKQWRSQPETKAFFQYLWHCRLYSMEEWARRGLLSSNAEESRDANSMALGGVKVLDSMLSVTAEDIEHFSKLTGGIGEFRYPTRRENDDPPRSGVDAAGEAGRSGVPQGGY